MTSASSSVAGVGLAPAEARAIIAHHSKSFSLASVLLGPDLRDAAAGLYAYCRRADDAVDLVAPAVAPSRVAQLRAELDDVYAGRSLSEPVLVEFQRLVLERHIPREYPDALLEGFRLDAEGMSYETRFDLYRYCWCVAGSVGAMMCHVLGVRRESAVLHGAHLGMAMQLTNICRDVSEDWQRRTLVQASNAFSPHDLVTQVLAPALDEIGQRWESGELCIASEHAASAMLRTQLGALLAAQPVNGKAPVVCTTPAGEQHELGALLAAVLIAMHGRRAIYLGANLPAEQIAQAARLSKAGSVALSLVGLDAQAARVEVLALCKALPPGVQVLVGGRRVAELPGLPERVHVLSSLPELENWLRNAPS